MSKKRYNNKVRKYRKDIGTKPSLIKLFLTRIAIIAPVITIISLAVLYMVCIDNENMMEEIASSTLNKAVSCISRINDERLENYTQDEITGYIKVQTLLALASMQNDSTYSDYTDKNLARKLFMKNENDITEEAGLIECGDITVSTNDSVVADTTVDKKIKSYLRVSIYKGDKSDSILGKNDLLDYEFINEDLQKNPKDYKNCYYVCDELGASNDDGDVETEENLFVNGELAGIATVGSNKEKALIDAGYTKVSYLIYDYFNYSFNFDNNPNDRNNWMFYYLS